MPGRNTYAQYKHPLAPGAIFVLPRKIAHLTSPLQNGRVISLSTEIQTTDPLLWRMFNASLRLHYLHTVDLKHVCSNTEPTAEGTLCVIVRIICSRVERPEIYVGVKSKRVIQCCDDASLLFCICLLVYRCVYH